MRAKTIKPGIHSTFKDFYDDAPAEIKTYIDRCASTPQSFCWHPEGDVKKHINIVFNRAKRTGDINFMLAAFFHDLGKADATRPHRNTPGKWSAHGHEFASARLVEKYRDWIESLGGDFEKVHFIVYEHMRVKHIHEMRPSKQATLRQNKYFDLVHQFSDFDDMLKDYSNDIDD
jgi:hypothetical protein